MNTWTVDPYIGVGPIRFGMTPKEVEAILGPVVETKDHSKFKGLQPFLMEHNKGFVTEFREVVAKSEPIIPYKFGEVVLIDFYKDCKSLKFREINLFKESKRKIIDKLSSISENIFLTFEGFIFLDFGIMLSSAENFNSNPNIGMTKLGYNDPQIENLMANNLGKFIKGGLTA
jgi:hypothetical protein